MQARLRRHCGGDAEANDRHAALVEAALPR
jgi:hypothetical protein